MTACSVWNAANAIAAGVADPVVTAAAPSDDNVYEQVGGSGTCYVGPKFDYNKTEYKRTPVGGYSSVGTWLTAGVPDDVWVIFTRTGGTESKWDNRNNSQRYQITADSAWYLQDTSTAGGYKTILGYFQFYDAASGGNLLDRAPTSGSSTWRCRLDEESCPTCCFTPWTLITMADGSRKRISEVTEDDIIRTLEGTEKVTGVIVRSNRPMYLITFFDGRILEASEDHPLYVPTKGFAAVNPDPTVDYKDLGVAETLGVGDEVLDEFGHLNRIESIEVMEYPDPVYTFANSKFYANGLLVY